MATKLQLAWLKSMVAPAQLGQRKWGVPASITLAQCILESAWGQSGLARRCNNYFGVKAIQGEDYMEFPTHEVVSSRTVVEMAAFAKYPSAIESFEAHAKLLATLPRYAHAMAASTDIIDFTYQLRQCGYSTAPDYPQQLRTLIAQFNLTQYDITPPPAAAKEAA